MAFHPKQLQGIAAHFRGHVKTKAKPLVEKHYKFKKGTGNEALNKEIYNRLKSTDYAYVNKVRMQFCVVLLTDILFSKSDKVDFEHEIISELLFESMFRNRTSIGIKFANYFNMNGDGLLPDTTIAFLVTTVSPCSLVTGVIFECSVD
jgi:hypothetical protein